MSQQAGMMLVAFAILVTGALWNARRYLNGEGADRLLVSVVGAACAIAMLVFALSACHRGGAPCRPGFATDGAGEAGTKKCEGRRL